MVDVNKCVITSVDLTSAPVSMAMSYPVIIKVALVIDDYDLITTVHYN